MATIQSQRPLPPGWRWVRLGEVCEFAYGTGLPSHARVNGKVPVYGSNGVVGYHDECVTKGPTIIIGRKGSIGEVHFSPVPCWPIDTTYYVDTPKSDVDLVWLLYWLRALKLDELNKAAAVPGLNRLDVYALEIPLPPQEEQKRIAAILNEQMAAVERARTAAEAQLEAANALPAAYLRAVFSSPEANEWYHTNIGSISTLVIDGPHVTPSYVPKGVPFLTVRNIVNRRIDLSDVSYVTSEDHAAFSGRGKAERGDILYTKDGTMGIPCVIETDSEFSFFVSVALIKLVRDRADPDFVALSLESPAVLNQVERLGAGAGLKHMVLKSIRALQIPLPPLPDQQRIAAMLKEQMASAQRAHKAIEEELDAINKLPAALLRRAFAGEL